MPCYGCGWDCCFGEAPCVQDLPFAVVREMLGELTAARPRGKATPGPALRYFSATRYPAETETWIKQASANYRQLKAAQAKANEDRETLERLLRESEADRAARLQTVSDLQKRLEAAEADRQARLEVIEDLEKRLGVSDADREARLKVIQDLQTRLEESEADRQARLEVIQDVQRRLEESDADRQARLVVMNNQVARLQELEAELAETRRYDVRTFPGIRLVAKKGKKP